MPAGAWPNWVLGNHDERRIATRLGWEESGVLAFLLLTLRGTPTIYYGDEIGMEELDIPSERQLDPYGRRVPGHGRDGCRTPMQWSSEPNAGFSPPATPSTWLPVHPGHTIRNVQDELNDPGSRLALYRRLLRFRKNHPALHSGDIEMLPSESKVIAFRRTHPDAKPIVILANLSDQPVPQPFDGGVVLSTDHLREGLPYQGGLGAWEALAVDPR